MRIYEIFLAGQRMYRNFLVGQGESKILVNIFSMKHHFLFVSNVVYGRGILCILRRKGKFFLSKMGSLVKGGDCSGLNI